MVGFELILTNYRQKPQGIFRPGHSVEVNLSEIPNFNFTVSQRKKKTTPPLSTNMTARHSIAHALKRRIGHDRHPLPY